jgi:hypothetical protein
MKKIMAFILGSALVAASHAFGAEADAIQPALQKAKSSLAVVLAAIDKDLANAAKKLADMDRSGGAARSVLSALCKDRPFAYDCAIIGLDGKLGLIEPEYARKYEGADISFEDSVKDVFKTRTSLVSKVFETLDGTSKIDFECPIINARGELVGSVSLLVNHDKLLEGVLAPLMKRQPCKIWVMQTNGLCIYDQDPAQINKNVLVDPMFQPFADLVAFAGKVAGEPAGAGSYSFYTKGLEDQTIVKKKAVWDTVKMPANEWRIVVVEIEGQKPAAKQAVQP